MNASKSKRKGKKILAYALLLAISFWWLPFSLWKSEGHEEEKASAEGNVIEQLFAHVEDHYDLHFGAVHIPLPMIVYKKGSGFYAFSSSRLAGHGGHKATYKGFTLNSAGIVCAVDGVSVYDFSITKNVVAMILSVLLILVLFLALAIYLRKRKKGEAPQGFWVLPLYVVRFVQNIAIENIGKKHAARFTPYLLTLFLYIIFNNLLGLLPEGANVTGSIEATFTLAFFTFVITNWHGSRHYWKHIFMPPGIPWYMLPIIVPIELLGLVMRPAVLCIRLFANIFAGHLLLLSVIGMIFILNNIFVSLFAVPLAAIMLIFKIFVSFIQAYVFTMLTAMAFGTAVEEH